jgi:cellulose synthase/poly-beta-1,6-N-acetylglucosamine synthase-like glycosyltransferase
MYENQFLTEQIYFVFFGDTLFLLSQPFKRKKKKKKNSISPVFFFFSIVISYILLMVKVLEPSVNETEFLLSALTEGKRVDGRGVYDVRSVEILLGADYGQVEVQLGRTRYS